MHRQQQKAIATKTQFVIFCVIFYAQHSVNSEAIKSPAVKFEWV